MKSSGLQRWLTIGLLAGAGAVVATRPVALAQATSSTQGPTLMFRSEVNLVAVDVQVVTREGAPITGLGIDDFSVTLNGHPRRVVSVDFVKKEPVLPPDAGGPDLPIYTPGRVDPGARIFVIVVDTNSFTNSSLKPAIQSAQYFLKQLPPDDFVALYTYPFSQPVLALTHDHRAVGRALDRVTGDLEPYAGNFDLSLTEVMDITAGDSSVLAKVVARECPTYGGTTDTTCPPSIQGEASIQAAYYESRAEQGLRGLSLLLEGLATMAGRKTVLLMSGGMPTADRVGSRPDLSGSMTRVGKEAAEADTSLYVMHIDDSFVDAFSASNSSSKDPARRIIELGRSTSTKSAGLERLSAASGGALLHVQAGTAQSAFDRVLRESAAFYMLGVQPIGDDRDGKLHFLHVNVKKRGVTVRSRTHVIIPTK